MKVASSAHEMSKSTPDKRTPYLKIHLFIFLNGTKHRQERGREIKSPVQKEYE